MNVESVLAAMNADIASRFRTAIELGKWPNGEVLTETQRSTCMEALIIWEAKNLPEEQRVGYIDKGKKQDGDVCDDPSLSNSEQPVTIRSS